MADPVRRVLGLVPALAAFVVFAAVPMPMFAIGPGPAGDVLTRIHIEGREVYPSGGHFLLTTVALQRATAFQALRGWIDRYIDVVPEREILPAGVSQAEEDRIQLSQMDESKLTAAAVALSLVGRYPEAHGSGALVRSVEPGGPADGRLFSGDLILTAAGRPVRQPADLLTAVRSAEGRDLVLEVRVEEHIRIEHVRPGTDGLGAEIMANFSFPLLIESGDIGGPSAGLMWSVGLIDLLTPGDLTGGRSIAGTGTIALDGSVGPIGGIGQKIVAADRAGADAFLVPRGDLPAARAVGSDVELVAVDDLQGALRWLLDRCGCELP